MIAHPVGVQAHVREALGDLVEEPGHPQPVDMGGELKPPKDAPHGGRDALDVGMKVGPDLIGVAQELLEVERGDVCEALPGLAQDEGLGVDAHALPQGDLGQHRILGGRQHAVASSQHGKGQDHLAVVRQLVFAAQEVGDGPQEGGQGGLVRGTLRTSASPFKPILPALASRMITCGSP